MNNTIITALMCVVFLLGCSKKVEETAAYQAACHGAPLKNIKEINQAYEDGYGVNQEFSCIDKASYLAMQAQEAERIAYNAPEAVAKRQAEFAKQKALDDERRAAEAVAEQQAAQQPLPTVVVHSVDANTATEAELAAVITIGPETAKQIIAARKKQRFGGWSDLVNNVVALSAAQTAVYASIWGLTVNGQSLDGAPQNAEYAAMLQEKYKQYQSP